MTAMTFAFHLLTLYNKWNDPFYIILSGLIVIIWGIMVSFSRIYFGAHYLQDIVGGWIFGIICGILGGPISYLIFDKIYGNTANFLLLFFLVVFIFHKHPMNRKSKKDFHYSECTADSTAPSIGCFAGALLVIYLTTFPPPATNLKNLFLRYLAGMPIAALFYIAMRSIFPPILEKIFKYFKVDANYIPYSDFQKHIISEMEKVRKDGNKRPYPEGKVCQVRKYAKFFQYILICPVLTVITNFVFQKLNI